MSKENADLKKLNISLKPNQKSEKNITEQTKKMKASKNLSNKQVSDAKKTLELSKKCSDR